MPSSTLAPIWHGQLASIQNALRGVPLIYLDNNASTRLSPAVTQRMHELMLGRLANPSSQHAAGRQARKVVEQARENILRMCGARTVGMASDQLIFTSGGTESNNLALFGLSAERPGTIVVSSIEHPSVLSCAEQLALPPYSRHVAYLSCRADGVVDWSQLDEWMKSHSNGLSISMVSLMLANNETGVLQQVQKAAEWCSRHGILIHTDASQVLGKTDLHFEALNVDAMTITAHKVHGPIGIGALILKRGVTLHPRSFGGFQQLGLRPGTEMPYLCAGFETAVFEATDQLQSRQQHMLELRKSFEDQLAVSIPECRILGADAPRLPHTISVSIPGIDRQALHLALDMAGIACSTGSACASGSSQPSHVLQAMHLPTEVVQGAIRFSLSHESTIAEITTTVERLRSIAKKLQKT